MVTTTHSAAALLGWLDPAQVTRHWHGQQEPKPDHRDDEPLVDAMEWDGGAADYLEPM